MPIQTPVAYPEKQKLTESTSEKPATAPSLPIPKGRLMQTNNNLQYKKYTQTTSTSIHTTKQHPTGSRPINLTSYQPTQHVLTETSHSNNTEVTNHTPARTFKSSSRRIKTPNRVNHLPRQLPSHAGFYTPTSISSLFPRAATLQSAHLDSTKQLLTTTHKHQRGIYLGLVIGPEFNQVKSQGPRKLGFDAGLLAGYRFNKRLAIESGFLFAKKYYYSDGRYFKMPGMSVISLEGCTSIFEIPLKLQYNVISKPTTAVFSAAGISSYLMTDEKNDYLLLINGSQQSMTGAYKEASRYFAAAIDLSIGYEKKIGKQTAIRIEPYLQIPLKGIGVGTMPVMSTGIHAGISRSFY